MSVSRTLIIVFFICIFSSCEHKIEDKTIRVDWVSDLSGNFSFTKRWNYPENVFKNSFGQLVCDGLCDPQLDLMRDENGRIYNDSLTRYYQLLDTTHQYYTISNEAQCDEWVGTDFAFAYYSGDIIKCYTATNAATHSILRLSVIGDKCIPQIELNSIQSSGIQYFECTGGYIKIDKMMVKKDILKADFNLTFRDASSPERPIWWKGQIYTSIQRQ